MAKKNYIRQWREYRGMTQPQLAELVDCSFQQISRLERGDRKLTQDWMERLTPALRCTETHLIRNAPPDGAKDGEIVDVQSEQLMVQLLRQILKVSNEQLDVSRQLLDAISTQPDEPNR